MRSFLGVILRPARKAFTLAELLVYQGLLVMLLALIVLFLVPGLRLSARGMTQSELLRGGHLAMDQLCRDLRLTPAASLTHQAGLGLCGRVGGGWTADGTVFPGDEAWIYPLSPTATLRRGTFSVTKERMLHSRFEPTQVQQALTLCHWRTLCTGVQSFRFEHSGPISTSPSGPYRLTLGLVVEGQTLMLQQSIQPRLSR